MRFLPLFLALCFLATPARAAQRVSLGLGISSQGSGPVLEVDLGRWRGEVRGESGEQHESFLLELRYPFRDSFALIGGTRFDQLELADRDLRYEGDLLFAGVRFRRESSRLSPFGAIRFLHGSATLSWSAAQQLVDIKGFGIEAGVVVPLHTLTKLTLLRRPGTFELVPTVEFQTLSPVDLEFTSLGLRVRYTMGHSP